MSLSFKEILFGKKQMGKSSEMIVFFSDNENSSDSLQLINPVTNLSLEHIDQRKCSKDLDDQSKKLEKLHLNDSKEQILKRNKTIIKSRHHPYIQPKKYKTKNENNKRNESNIKFLKSLGYIQYSSSKESKQVKMSNDVDEIRSLFVQVNNSIKLTFSKYIKSIDQSKQNHYICNRRFH